nr:hypothetical protein [Lachnospiraceae bacterium]
DDSEISDRLTYNPDDEAMQTLADLKPEWFVYHKPFLMNRGENILYGIAADRNETYLEIPEGIEVYDNFFIHEEDYGYETIVIPNSLVHISNWENPFGYHVKNYKVDTNHPCFAEANGLLMDSDYYTLLLFPSGRNTGTEYVVLDFRDQTFNEDFDLTIGEYAFCMRGFVKALVLPPFCDFNEKSFYIFNGTGKIIAGNYRKDKLDKIVKTGRIVGTDICYYDVFNYKDDFTGVDEEGFFVAPPLCESLDEVGNFVPLPVDSITVKNADLEFDQIPITLVIPDTVQTIEDGALSSLFGKGRNAQGIEKRCVILPERFLETIDREWTKGEDKRPIIIYY